MSHLQQPPPVQSPQAMDLTTAELINRLVIEDDVVPVLPSVKKLASAFASKQTVAQVGDEFA